MGNTNFFHDFIHLLICWETIMCQNDRGSGKNGKNLIKPQDPVESIFLGSP